MVSSRVLAYDGEMGRHAVIVLIGVALFACGKERVITVVAPRECDVVTARQPAPVRVELEAELDRKAVELSIGAARAAFHAGDYVKAAELAKDTLPLATGTMRFLAAYLYADSLFHSGKYQTAKTVLQAVRPDAGDHDHAVAAKIRACERALRPGDEPEAAIPNCSVYERLPNGGCIQD